MSFYFCSLLEPDYLSHFLCPRWVCRSVQGLQARHSSILPTPQRLPDGRQPAYLGCRSTLHSPAGVSCTGSSRPWRCQSVWSGSSHYCRTIPETGSSEPWGQHRIRKQKVSIKGQNDEMVDCKSCHNTLQLLPSRCGLYSLDLCWPMTCSDHRDWWKWCCVSPEPGSFLSCCSWKPCNPSPCEQAQDSLWDDKRHLAQSLLLPQPIASQPIDRWVRPPTAGWLKTHEWP